MAGDWHLKMKAELIQDLRKRQLEVGRVGGTFLGGRFARVTL